MSRKSLIERLWEYENFLAKQAKYHKGASEFESLAGSIMEEMIAEEYEKSKEELYKLFPELLKIREKEMCSVAGKDLVKKMKKVLGKENYLEWFYSPNTALNDKSPYDLCKEGKKSEISDLIGRIDHGVFS